MNQAKSASPPLQAAASPPSPNALRYHLCRGLDASEVEKSGQIFGYNSLTKKKKAGFLRQFFRNFNDPIIRILLGALCLNVLLSFGHVNWFECGGIAVAVLISTLVSTISEFSSAAALDALQNEAEDTAVTVRRGGCLRQIPLSEIVVGDVVMLNSGATVQADGILCAGRVAVDQSPLTGESEEKQKIPSPAITDTGILTPDTVSWDPGKDTQLFRGSRVCQGEGEMLVCRVGDRTLYGGVASGLQEDVRPSPLKERLSGLAQSVSFLGYVAAAVIAFAYLFNVFVIDNGMNWDLIRHRITDLSFTLPHLIRALSVAISILVVAVPEGLPMMITVVLSSNMKKMLRSGVLVRRLVGIETAGNMNILFTDKTGTLTCGKLKVEAILCGDTVFDSLAALKKSPAHFAALRQNHAACAGIGRGNATDRAVNSFFNGCKTERIAVMHRLPFDSARRYSSGCVENGGRIRTLIRGAPEVILTHAASYLDRDGRLRPMTPAVMAKIRKDWEAYAAASHRVIAVAEYDGENKTESGAFSDLIFVALIAIRDRLRPDAADAVATARRAGIQTVMITGDNPLTAEAIARECGILYTGGPHRVLTGEELARMTDEELSAILPQIAVVARALPTDKSRLVRLSQERGMVVGMTGDGINDAPALRASDVGFAMGSGTDAAREAGDIVITDDRFSSIMQAVLYGRTIFLSIRKFIVFQLSMNLCAVGVSLIGPFIGVETPVTVIQMLWVNIIMDTLGALAFAGEPSLMRYMHCPPLSRQEKLLSPAMIRNILASGGFSLALCLWFLKSPLMHRVFARGDEIYYLSVFFALFIFCGLYNCFLARSEGVNILSHLSANKPFILIVCTVCVTQLMIIYFGGQVFRCDPLTAREITLSALLAGSVVPAELIRRAIRQLRKDKKRDTV